MSPQLEFSQKMCQISRKLGISWDLLAKGSASCLRCLLCGSQTWPRKTSHSYLTRWCPPSYKLDISPINHSEIGVMFSNLTILGVSYPSISHLLLGISQFSKLDDGCSGEICHGSGLPRLGAMFEILRDIQPRTWEFKLQHLQHV